MTRAIPEWWVGANGWDFWDTYDKDDWEPWTRLVVDTLVKPDTTFVDIGTWIGPVSLWAAPLAGRVVGVEPDPVAAECYRQNLAGYTNVELVEVAITAETGFVELMAHEEGFGSSMTRIRHDGFGASLKVPALTVPDLFDEYQIENVSLVKMDIEGAESLVLEALCPWFAGREIPLLVSLHPDWCPTPVEMSWFDCFSHVKGDGTASHAVLAIP